MKKSLFIIIVATIFFVLGSYQVFAVPSPLIANISPVLGPIGTEVIITGSRFDLVSNRINFAGGVIMDVPSKDGKTLSFIVSKDRIPLCRYEPPFCSIILPDLTPGIYTISITNNFGTSNLQKFKVTR